MGVTDSRSLRLGTYVRMKELVRQSTFVLFRRFLGSVRREFMQLLSVEIENEIALQQYRQTRPAAV
jgi:hypothetical protein